MSSALENLPEVGNGPELKAGEIVEAGLLNTCFRSEGFSRSRRLFEFGAQ